jgi:hypothetical protein
VFGGDYIKFNEMKHTPGTHDLSLLSSSTGTTCGILALSILFMIVQWCEQAHISTVDYESAKHGLLICRAVKSWTNWLRSDQNHLLQALHTAGARPFGGSPR